MNWEESGNGDYVAYGMKNAYIMRPVWQHGNEYVDLFVNGQKESRYLGFSEASESAAVIEKGN